MFDAKLDSRAFDAALDEFGKTLRRPMSFMARPAEDWYFRTGREQFDSRGAAGASGRWSPLAASTLRRKALEGRGFQILERTGSLRAAFTRPGSLYQIIERTDDKIVFRTSHPAAGFHQSGTRRMPQRKVVDPSPAQVEGLARDVAKEAAEVARRLGIRTKG